MIIVPFFRWVLAALGPSRLLIFCAADDRR
jgi:hypothetical protein